MNFRLQPTAIPTENSASARIFSPTLFKRARPA